MKLKNSNVFSFFTISDIHLGNKRNTSEEIIANLDRELSDEKIAHLDMIVFVGDVFDGLLSSVDVLIIDVWIARFLRRTVKHGVKVFFLEGTPSHEWKQPNRFVYINGVIANIGADLTYINELTIWYEERFDKNFLFVPDEWATTTEETYSQVKQLLKNRGLDKVDYAFVHGLFEFQVPAGLKIPHHRSIDYLPIVDKLIFVGHDHRYANYDRIYAQGSFDRLSHGEEEAKGLLHVNVYNDGHYTVDFVENTQAKIFKTIDCKGMSVDKTLNHLKNITNTLPHGSYVRIMAESTNPIFTNMDEVVRQIPHCVWSKKPVELDKEIKKVINDDIDEIYKPVEITRDNVKYLLNERISNSNVDNNLLPRITMYIDEII